MVIAPNRRRTVPQDPLEQIAHTVFDCAGSGLSKFSFQGRASDLLYTGRSMSAEEGLAWGFFNRITDDVLPASLQAAKELAAGPTLAHAMTKKMLHEEWHVSVDRAIDLEAQAQAELMLTRDFHRAYEAFAEKRKPVFEGD